jgi:membrane associated rhomboid family serine protease
VIPLRHTLPIRKTPYVNRGLVAMNVFVFIAEVLAGAGAEGIIHRFGFLPARLLAPAAYGSAPWEVAITLVSSLFLHGGFVHLIGNMIYLWVFGGAVEEAVGHTPYLFLYLGCGVVGSLTHTLFFPHSIVPSIGASGSIAGILGALLVLRPRARIVTLFPLVVYWAMAEIPAPVFIPIWFALQFFNGLLSLAAARGTQEVAMIAWWAHVGGFTVGLVAGFFFRRTRSVSHSSKG